MEILYNKEKKEIKENSFHEEISKLLNEDVNKNKKNKIVYIEILSSDKGSTGSIEYQIVIDEKKDTFFFRLINDALDLQQDNSVIANKVCFLTCIDIEKNQYKYYKMELDSNKNLVTCSYGRMANARSYNCFFGERTSEYPASQFYVKYNEKINKGYVDRTDIYLSEKITDVETNGPDNDALNEGELFFKSLLTLARKTLKQANVTIPVTLRIIEEAEKLIGQLLQTSNYKEFVSIQLELMSIMQRPIDIYNGVKSLIISEERFNNGEQSYIIKREEDILDSLKTIYAYNKRLKTTENETNVNVSYVPDGITISVTDENERNDVISRLGDNLRSKVTKVYRMVCETQEKRFNEYLRNEGITNVKMFWHGSRNENWASIITNSLKLKPNAVITGKMFGNGIYFAPSAAKSFGYTSYNGTYWANGRDDVAYMGLYATAYGEPYYVGDHEFGSYEQNVKKNNKNCLHAKQGTRLKNDEVVFYSEDALLLKYIVEFQ